MTNSTTSRAMLAAILAVGLTAPVVAQEKKPAAAPAAKPAAPAAAAPAADAGGKQSAWVKLCEKAAQVTKDKDGKEAKTEKNICLTHHERLDGNTGMVIVSAALREVEGNDKKQFMIMVPLGMALPPGLKAAVYTKDMWEKAAKNEKVDEAKLKPVDLKFSLCHAAGCTAEIEATPDLISSMKTGGGLMVLALNAAAQPIGFPVPLEGFDTALGGAPVDNQKYFEARQDLMKRIRELQVERYEKFKAEQLKNLPPPPAGQPAPATASVPAPAAPAQKK
ncbi:MAG: invasion associated locus B family protein [Hyphomicrobiaceae bacterium]|nr:invasion associated locus B family protein [Hyphomicrobiaceae bacterium]